MPRTRVRTTDRGNWTERDLLEAVKLINEEQFSIRAAARETGIPERTIRRRISSNNFAKTGCGPQSLFGTVTENKLVDHIVNLQGRGFSPTPSDVRQLAFELAAKLKLLHRFNANNGRAGRDWFRSFMQRNPTLSIRKAENLSVARATGMNRDDVNRYFSILEKSMIDANIVNKPSAIYNMDESGFQLNNEAGKVVAKKGSKDVHHISSTERGENITVVTCCNAEGHFLPPFCIFKGVNKKNEWQDMLPPGSDIRMSPKSSYITSEIFLIWLQEHFIPRKTPGKVILLLDGHSSHMSVPALELAAKNDIIFICFPSHTTHFLQPLDRSFFKPLKHFFKDACNTWMLNHFRGTAAGCKQQAKPTARKIGRMQFGELLSKAWGRAATPQNAISGFKATGVVPLDKKAIPDYAFIADINLEEESQMTENLAENSQIIQDKLPSYEDNPLEGPSTLLHTSPLKNSDLTENSENETPSKIIKKLSPLPMVQKPKHPSKRKQRAEITTSLDYIKKKKTDQEKRQDKQKSKQPKEKTKNKKNDCLKKKNSTSLKQAPSKKKLKYESTSDSEESVVLMDSDDSVGLEDFFDDSHCVECLELYEETKSSADWIKCIACNRWLHETCSIYAFSGKCGDCGRKEIRMEKLKGKKLLK